MEIKKAQQLMENGIEDASPIPRADAYNDASEYDEAMGVLQGRFSSLGERLKTLPLNNMLLDEDPEPCPLEDGRRRAFVWFHHNSQAIGYVNQVELIGTYSETDELTSLKAEWTPLNGRSGAPSMIKITEELNRDDIAGYDREAGDVITALEKTMDEVEIEHSLRRQAPRAYVEDLTM
jgi:hypothetical protein